MTSFNSDPFFQLPAQPEFADPNPTPAELAIAAAAVRAEVGKAMETYSDYTTTVGDTTMLHLAAQLPAGEAAIDVRQVGKTPSEVVLTEVIVNCRQQDYVPESGTYSVAKHMDVVIGEAAQPISPDTARDIADLVRGARPTDVI